MLSMLHTAFIYVVPFLLVLTLVVTVHELGHFLVAKWCGVAIDQFSIGFGRPLLHWTDRSGVQWRVGWLPLGGYVRFSGDSEASSSVPDAASLAELKRDIALREGVGAERKYFHFKPVWQRAAVVAAGPMANFVLAVALFAVLLGSFGETLVTTLIGRVQPNTPASRAGFQVGDLITAMDGRAINDFMAVKQYVALRSGTPIRFTVTRAGSPLDLVVAPERRASKDPLTGAPMKMGMLGIAPRMQLGDIYHKRYRPGEAVVGGVKRTADIVQTTVFYLGRLVRGLDSGDQLGGPLRIAATSKAAAEAGAEGAPNLGGKLLGGSVALLSLAAVLSVGIGFMNLLPVPVLDGGHLVFYAYEAVARRPVAAKVQALGYRLGLALLLGLMLFATWNDLQQLSVFKLLGGLFS